MPVASLSSSSPTPTSLGRWGLLLWLVVLTAGCDGVMPSLDSAVFEDDVVSDGALGEGERIVLTFDAPVALARTSEAGEAKGTGVQFEPARSGRMNAYSLSDSRTDNRLAKQQIAVEIVGFAEAVVTGRHGHDEDATGVVVDYAMAGIVDAAGQPLSGRSAIVDLSPRPKSPPRLRETIWVDRDGSRSVSEGDEIELVFDEPVEPSDRVRATGSVVPRELFSLPVEGDRFDDGRRESRLRRAGPDRVSVVLGSNPRLTPEGEFAAGGSYRGSPSGIAINGTTIRPNPAIVDRSGVGVAGPSAVDLSGECTTLFRGEIDRSHLKSLERFTITPLTEKGDLVVAGGWDSARGAATRQGLIRRADGSTREFELPEPRYGHVALPFPGPDGVRGTSDDFVIIGGGLTNATTPARTTLVLMPFADSPNSPRLRAVEMGDDDPLARIGSTVCALAPDEIDAMDSSDTGKASSIGGAIIVLGGFDEDGRFVASLDTVVLSAAGDSAAVERDNDSLRWPRAYAASVVAGPDATPWLFLYGGYTRGLLSERTLFRTLSHPELFELRLSRDGRPTIDLVPVALPDAEQYPAAPGARFGHRLIDLGTEGEPILLVGGSGQVSADASGRTQDSRVARFVHRIEIEPRSLEPVRYRVIGESVVERRNPTCLRSASGQIVIVGGEDREQRALRTAEVIDPARDAVEIACQSLIHARRRFGGAPTGDGGWILIGGAAPSDDWAAEIVEAP